MSKRNSGTKNQNDNDDTSSPRDEDDEIARLADKAKQRADEYNRNVAAAEEKRAKAVAFLERALEAVTQDPGTLEACSEPIVISLRQRDLLPKPERQTSGKGIHVLGDGPQHGDGFERELPVTGRAVYLTKEGVLLRLTYTGKKTFGEIQWAASSATRSAAEIIEEFGEGSSRVIFTNIEKALTRHGGGGRDKDTESRLSDATRFGAMAVVMELLFPGGRR